MQRHSRTDVHLDAHPALPEPYCVRVYLVTCWTMCSSQRREYSILLQIPSEMPCLHRSVSLRLDMLPRQRSLLQAMCMEHAHCVGGLSRTLSQRCHASLWQVGPAPDVDTFSKVQAFQDASLVGPATRRGLDAKHLPNFVTGLIVSAISIDGSFLHAGSSALLSAVLCCAVSCCGVSFSIIFISLLQKAALHALVFTGVWEFNVDVGLPAAVSPA